MNSFKKTAWNDLISKYLKEGYLSALDIGTGPGFFSIILSELGLDVTGMDCSDEMLKEAERNIDVAGYKAKFINGDCHEVSFGEETFDFIICRNLVWTLVNPQKAYNEWYRVLKQGGRLVVIDANWFLRLSDELAFKKYEQVQKKARELGYLEREISKTQEEECIKIAKNLPLTYEKRPKWDEKALLECGFKDVVVEEDISEQVYDDRQKVLYGYAPLFVVSATK